MVPFLGMKFPERASSLRTLFSSSEYRSPVLKAVKQVGKLLKVLMAVSMCYISKY